MRPAAAGAAGREQPAERAEDGAVDPARRRAACRRRRTATSCRSTRISTSLVASERASSASQLSRRAKSRAQHAGERLALSPVDAELLVVEEAAVSPATRGGPERQLGPPRVGWGVVSGRPGRRRRRPWRCGRGRRPGGRSAGPMPGSRRSARGRAAAADDRSSRSSSARGGSPVVAIRRSCGQRRRTTRASRAAWRRCRRTGRSRRSVPSSPNETVPAASEPSRSSTNFTFTCCAINTSSRSVWLFTRNCAPFRSKLQVGAGAGERLADSSAQPWRFRYEAPAGMRRSKCRQMSACWLE